VNCRVHTAESGQASISRFVAALCAASARSRIALALPATVAGVLMISSVAMASPPETPEALPATSVTATTATLNGTLNPGAPGLPGSFQFSYAPSETLECGGGSLAPLSPAFAVGTEKEAVSTPVSELQPDKEYAACLTAFSLTAEPSSPSPVVSFKTPAAKPSIDSESASSVTSSAATLEAQINPENQSTTYTFEYSEQEKAGVLEGTIEKVPGSGPLEGFGDQTASVPAGVLSAGTTYFYRVVAENEQSKAEGKPATGPVVSFTTVAAPQTDPVTAITATTATFNGTLTPLNKTLAAEYSFDYNVGSEDCSGASATAVTTAGTGTAAKAVEAEVSELQPGATYSVCLVSSNAFGSEVDSSSPQVSFKTLAGPPSILSESSSQITPEGATLEAQVDPNNQETSCKFEYSSEEAKVTAGEGTTVPCAQPLGGGGSPATGSATISGLHLQTTYFYRAVAENAAHETTTDSTIEHFETETTVKPALESETATGITATSATLDAKVNPNGAQITSCVFEYGTDTSYGHDAPCEHPDALELGAGRAPVMVSATISSLSVRTYHWRLTATSAAGADTSVDHTFIDATQSETALGSCKGQEHEGQEKVREETHSTALPDCRAYELVTPPEKNGAHIEALFAGTGSWGPVISGDGMHVLAPSIQCFAGAESCTGLRSLGEGEPYEFERPTGGGWVTHPLAPPAATFGDTSQLNEDATTHDTLFSAPGEGEREHFYVRSGTGAPRDIGPVGENAEQVGGEDLVLLPNDLATMATSDFSHLVFAANSTGNNKALWSLSGFPELDPSLYEYAGTGNAHPLLVGVSGGFDSTHLISECGTAMGDFAYTHAVEYGSLSENGHIVYFSAIGHDNRACPGEAPSHSQLFARVDGESPGLAHTVAISAPTPGSCNSAECEASQSESDSRDASFAGASADGSRVFFTSTQQLTDDASQMAAEPGQEGEAGKNCSHRAESGCNLYESICAEPCGTHEEEPAAKSRALLDISAGAKTKGGPRVRGVMAISSDGSHVYFVAQGKLASNPGVLGATAEEGKANLYVYAEGQPLRFIATLPPSDEQEFEQQGFNEWTEGVFNANVTPDGRFLVFLSHAALTPDDTRPEGPAQIYRYDAETNTIVRISIGQKGFNDDGNDGTAGAAEPNILPAYKGWQTTASPANANPTMSNDGQYVFFESPVALAPGALNEETVNGPPGREFMAQNVYEYHDGEVHLISDGKDTSPNPGDPSTKSSTRLIGTDPSGKNVFFWTDSQISAQDTDTQRDIYDARICEAAEPCIAPPTTAQPCLGEECHLSAPPGGTPNVSGSNTLEGTGNLGPEAIPGVTPQLKVLTRAAHGAKFTLRITLSGSGRVTVTGSGVDKASRALKVGGTQTVEITLTRAARHELAHKHKMTLKLRIVFTPAIGRPISRVASVTIKV
jgi:hypothetical protein